VTVDRQGTPFPAEPARRIRLVVFDSDGVLTDASVSMGALADGSTVELKSFDIQDGIGMKLLRMAGLHVPRCAPASWGSRTASRTRRRRSST
jgi:hypothetical protein